MKWIKLSDEKPPSGKDVLIYPGYGAGLLICTYLNSVEMKKKGFINILGEKEYLFFTSGGIEPSVNTNALTITKDFWWMPLPELPEKK